MAPPPPLLLPGKSPTAHPWLASTKVPENRVAIPDGRGAALQCPPPSVDRRATALAFARSEPKAQTLEASIEVTFQMSPPPTGRHCACQVAPPSRVATTKACEPCCPLIQPLDGDAKCRSASVVKRRLTGGVVVVGAAEVGDLVAVVGFCPPAGREAGGVAVAAVESVVRGLVRGVMSPAEGGTVVGPAPAPPGEPAGLPASTATNPCRDPEECLTRARAPSPKRTATAVAHTNTTPWGRPLLGARPAATPTSQRKSMRRIRPPAPSCTAPMKPHFGPG